MNGGAPSDSCKALAPKILAFSKRVNVGGPIVIFPLPVVSYSTGTCIGSISITSLASIIFCRLCCSASSSGVRSPFLAFFSGGGRAVRLAGSYAFAEAQVSDPTHGL